MSADTLEVETVMDLEFGVTGLAFSPDDSMLYHSDTPPNRVFKYPISGDGTTVAVGAPGVDGGADRARCWRP